MEKTLKNRKKYGKTWHPTCARTPKLGYLKVATSSVSAYKHKLHVHTLIILHTALRKFVKYIYPCMHNIANGTSEKCSLIGLVFCFLQIIVPI